MPEVMRQDDRRGDHRTGERTAPGLVDAGHAFGGTAGAQALLVEQMRPRWPPGERVVHHGGEG
jgi:hypothetical protein